MCWACLLCDWGPVSGHGCELGTEVVTFMRRTAWFGDFSSLGHNSGHHCEVVGGPVSAWVRLMAGRGNGKHVIGFIVRCRVYGGLDENPPHRNI